MQDGYLQQQQTTTTTKDCALKCVDKNLKSTKTAMDEVYWKLLQVMKQGYIILNLRGKLTTRCF